MNIPAKLFVLGLVAINNVAAMQIQSSCSDGYMRACPDGTPLPAATDTQGMLCNGEPAICVLSADPKSRSSLFETIANYKKRFF